MRVNLAAGIAIFGFAYGYPVYLGKPGLGSGFIYPLLLFIVLFLASFFIPVKKPFRLERLRKFRRLKRNRV
ncbi:hypothetical protein [Spirosoma foliorum]|uniref:Uncharacterized protein n=1 Tax=Spirosoma foliorum TaxID=2710596 RepID=A0A7G5H596_9BACT|nr:hypothetical protein [Spirosoma foliorum]QMW06288.1 hypothetical protein H3H32_16080 [Spirosoma foliorum]